MHRRECVVVLLLLTLGLSTAANAGQFSVTVSGKSYHLEKTKNGYNEDNPGLGLQYDFDRQGAWIPYLTTGGFVDSFGDMSYIAGGGYRRRLAQLGGEYGFYFDAGGAALLMTRETYKNNQPFPVILPTASLGTRSMALDLTYVPEYQSWVNPLVFLQFRYSLQ